VYRNMEI